ncbi:hypothetical protein GCM10023259_000540 [Thermocatellispora tengchongensis]
MPVAWGELVGGLVAGACDLLPVTSRPRPLARAPAPEALTGTRQDLAIRIRRAVDALPGGLSLTATPREHPPAYPAPRACARARGRPEALRSVLTRFLTA